MTTLAEVANTEVYPGYHLKVESCQGHLFLCVPEDYGHRAKPFEHHKLALKRWCVNSYKHYMVHGKKWTERAGIEYVFAVPLDRIEYVGEKCNYSYVPVAVGGERFILDVSGGTIDGWTDWVHAISYTSVNMPRRIISAIAAAAVDPSTIELPEFNEYEEYEIKRIRLLVAEVEMRKALAPGLTLCLEWDCQFNDGGRERTIRSVNRKRRSVIVEGAWGGCRVKYSQIDWLKTALENNIELPDIPVFEKKPQKVS